MMKPLAMYNLIHANKNCITKNEPSNLLWGMCSVHIHEQFFLTFFSSFRDGAQDLCMLGKHSTPELHPQPNNYSFDFTKRNFFDINGQGLVFCCVYQGR
jgi:hypothetical protein